MSDRDATEVFRWNLLADLAEDDHALVEVAWRARTALDHLELTERHEIARVAILGLIDDHLIELIDRDGKIVESLAARPIIVSDSWTRDPPDAPVIPLTFRVTERGAHLAANPPTQVRNMWRRSAE